MTTPTPADHYRELAHKFTDRIEAVPDDRWGNPSPCEGWTARDVVRHVVDTQRDIVTVVGLELERGPSVDDDPLGAWLTTRDSMQKILDDPARGGREYDGHFGRTTLAQTVDGFHCFDLVIHGWDLARATGTDETIPPSDLEWVESVATSLGDNIRMAGVCGPEVPVSDDADAQTKLLAHLGRSA